MIGKSIVSASAGLLAAFVGGMIASQASEEAVRQRPNILLIVSDNQGWNDIGYHGSEIQTPNLDQLARAGVRLEQFYVYPMCSPTRAALISGRAPSRYGINGAIGYRSRQALPPDTVTIADTLRDAGYETAISGKWHVGLRRETGPLQYGFDQSYGFFHGQIDKYTHLYKNGDRTWHRNDQFVDEEGHSLDLMTRESLEFIRRDRDRPFFLYVAFGAPHPPLQEEERWIHPYESTIDSPSRRLYAAAVTHMDHAVGRLIDALEETGQRDTTCVVFFSDNGPIENLPLQPQHYGGQFPAYPILGDNSPLRGWIGELYDGCLRTPAFVNWRGVLSSAVVDDVTSVLDWFPTFAAMAETRVDDGLKLEGRNIWPLLLQKKPPEPIELYWRNYNGARAAVRSGNWKLIADRTADSSELYDLSRDPGEQHDVASAEPDRVQQLLNLLDDLAAADLPEVDLD